MFRLDKDLKQIEVHETKLISKLKSLAEQLEKQKEINREKLKECKYINLFKFIYLIISW